jgi:hypothetical protein
VPKPSSSRKTPGKKDLFFNGSNGFKASAAFLIEQRKSGNLFFWQRMRLRRDIGATPKGFRSHANGCGGDLRGVLTGQGRSHFSSGFTYEAAENAPSK